MAAFCDQFLPRNVTLPHYSQFWTQFVIYYMPIHKIISIIIVVAGLIMNILLLTVLTHKKMASPSNTFLIGISIADTTVLVTYFFSWIPLIAFNNPFSYEFHFWSIGLLIGYLIFRSISSWITVFLALWRVITLYAPFQTFIELENRNAIIIIVSCFIIIPIGFFPHLYSMHVIHDNCAMSVNGTLRKNFFYIGHQHESVKALVVFLDGMLMQFIPCLILVILTAMILLKISESRRRKACITNTQIHSSKPRDQKTGDSNQTANALLAIVILFLVCELPVGLLLLGVAIDKRILYTVFVKVKYFTFFLRLLNASLNFVMYCFMSSLFRSTFMEVFGGYLRWKSMSFQVSDTEKSDSSKKTDNIELS